MSKVNCTRQNRRVGGIEPQPHLIPRERTVPDSTMQFILLTNYCKDVRCGNNGKYFIIFACFFILQGGHSGWIFSILSEPPFESGIMWSCVSLISGSDFLQQGQVQLY